MLTSGLLLAIALAASDPTAEARFDEMAKRHLTDFKDLAGIRGATLYEHGPLPLAGLKSLLAGAFDPDTAVLVYAYRQDAQLLDAWLVRSDGIRASASTPITEDELEAAVASVQTSLGADDRVAARSPRPRGFHVAVPSRPAVPDGLARLGHLLLPPHLAAELSFVKELLVVPTLAVGAVPFGALPVGLAPLIEGRTVTILPNLFGLGAVDAAARTGALAPALVVGDPDLSRDPDWEFPRLDGARAEAEFVASLMRASALLGGAATFDEVTAAVRASPPPQLLYLATHGVALPDDPMGGFLALSTPWGDVYRWTAGEIQTLRARARLAVLSACQTGLGRGHRGGMIGVARAFQLAGVRNVVMSLWNVDDQATARLMEGFLRRATLMPPAEALREAMLEARRRNPNPLDWAAFALFATPPGRPGAGVGVGAARLVLEDPGGKVIRHGETVRAGRELGVRVEGEREAPRLFRYLLKVDASGDAALIHPPDRLRLAAPLGPTALLLVEADRPLGDSAGAEHRWAQGGLVPPRTLAGLAALFPLNDPRLRLRILQLQVELAGPERPPHP